LNPRKFESLPALGDIVYCRSPEVKNIPAAKPRLTLVMATVEFDSGSHGVRVAYRMSKRVSELRAGEFAITPADGQAYTHAGLSYPTKFDLKRHEDLPYTEAWFRVPPNQPFGQCPKLGILHPSLVRRAEAAFNAIALPKNS
jgi:hypothetical protein